MDCTRLELVVPSVVNGRASTPVNALTTHHIYMVVSIIQSGALGHYAILQFHDRRATWQLLGHPINAFDGGRRFFFIFGYPQCQCPLSKLDVGFPRIGYLHPSVLAVIGRLELPTFRAPPEASSNHLS